jgi:hypothetical protein
MPLAAEPQKQAQIRGDEEARAAVAEGNIEWLRASGRVARGSLPFSCPSPKSGCSILCGERAFAIGAKTGSRAVTRLVYPITIHLSGHKNAPSRRVRSV